MDLDERLTAQERASFRRRLENRVGLLDRSPELQARIDAYRMADGRLVLFKFDPWLNGFPTLLEPATGLLRLLYPGAADSLEWRNSEGQAIGRISFEGRPGYGELVLQDTAGVHRARPVGLVKETLRFEVGDATLEGTLFRPPGGHRVTAVVLTHGAGLSSRYNLVSEALAYASAGVAAFVTTSRGSAPAGAGTGFSCRSRTRLHT